MKVILKYILVLSGFVLLMAGCRKAEILPYQSTNDVYFDWTRYLATGGAIPYDSIKTNFAFNGNSVLDTVFFSVRLLGNPANADRAFNLIVDQEQSTAVEGTDYRLPSPGNFIIKADSVSQQLQVQILRREGLRNKSFKLVFKLVPNENFGVNKALFYGLTYNVQTGGDTMEILIQDLLLKPQNWDGNENVLGKFSRKKLELFVGQEELDLNFFSIYSSSNLTLAAKAFQRYLNDQKRMGNTVLEEDGSEMKMGIDAQ